ncbi:MAG: hypothetical protein ABIE43_04520 [Patescibacteria group bacterium]
MAGFFSITKIVLYGEFLLYSFYLKTVKHNASNPLPLVTSPATKILKFRDETERGGANKGKSIAMVLSFPCKENKILTSPLEKDGASLNYFWLAHGYRFGTFLTNTKQLSLYNNDF